MYGKAIQQLMAQRGMGRGLGPGPVAPVKEPMRMGGMPGMGFGAGVGAPGGLPMEMPTRRTNDVLMGGGRMRRFY